VTQHSGSAHKTTDGFAWQRLTASAQHSVTCERGSRHHKSQFQNPSGRISTYPISSVALTPARLMFARFRDYILINLKPGDKSLITAPRNLPGGMLAARRGCFNRRPLPLHKFRSPLAKHLQRHSSALPRARDRALLSARDQGPTCRAQCPPAARRFWRFQS
jgi:hypothetical protein